MRHLVFLLLLLTSVMRSQTQSYNHASASQVDSVIGLLAEQASRDSSLLDNCLKSQHALYDAIFQYKQETSELKQSNISLSLAMGDANKVEAGYKNALDVQIRATKKQAVFKWISIISGAIVAGYEADLLLKK